MNIDQKKLFEIEIQNATKSRASGMEGRARVCARRAAAILVRDYLQAHGGIPPQMNDLQILLLLAERPPSTQVSILLKEYLEQVDPMYQLPSGADLIADLGELARLLGIDINPDLPANNVIIYGADWCPDCSRVKRIFIGAGIDFTWLDVHSKPEYEAFVTQVNHGFCSVPTIIFPDGTMLVEPSNEELLRAISSHFPT
jgi:mycoredoxin